MISRRAFFKLFGATVALGLGLGGYATAVEPLLRLRVQRYRLTPPNWPDGLRLTLAVIADPHACEPWMSARRLEGIADFTNTLGADAVLLMGDYDTAHPFITRTVPAAEWASALGRLSAPFGVHAVMGNHDWWNDPDALRRRHGPVYGQTALEAAGVMVHENHAVRLEKDGQPFWIAGLGDQFAFPARGLRRGAWATGIDDLDGTLAQVTDDAPVILLAHEPDIFPRVPERVALTVCGHTHGGQVRLFRYAPVVPSVYGDRYAYGHIVEGGRNLIVSAGMGCSMLPIRFGIPPEVVVIELGD